jgi:hypothetical protein
MNMRRGLSSGNPIVMGAFRNALDRQLLMSLFLGMVFAIVWNSVPTVRYRWAALAGRGDAPATPRTLRWPATCRASFTGSDVSSMARTRPSGSLASVSPRGTSKRLTAHRQGRRG